MGITVRGPGGMASILELTMEIKRDPNNALLHAERSECFRRVQQYYHAIRDAEAVIRLCPDWHEGYYLKGLAQYGAEDFKSALETFEDGVEYKSSESMIRALQKANRSWFISKLNNVFRAFVGFFLGCSVGLLALAVNEYVLPRPIVANVFLKISILGMWCFFGFESGKNFSNTLQDLREKRLQPPDDLFPFNTVEAQKKSVNPSIGTSTKDLGNPEERDESTTRTGRAKKHHVS